jgi:hypothetical protein
VARATQPWQRARGDFGRAINVPRIGRGWLNDMYEVEFLHREQQPAGSAMYLEGWKQSHKSGKSDPNVKNMTLPKLCATVLDRFQMFPNVVFTKARGSNAHSLDFDE